MRPKYRWTQILGVLICIAGLGLLVASDVLTDKDYAAVNMALGDVFMIIGASLYGFSEWLPSLEIGGVFFVFIIVTDDRCACF